MNKKIIICDDNQEILDLFEIILSAEGYVIDTEINSSKLMDRLHENTPDLLLLDLWMPRVSGEEILKAIRIDSSLKNLKVIIISASLDGKTISKISDADDYIDKPFDVDDMLSKISGQLIE